MNDGAISELVSRGKKDAYFIQNSQRTWFGTRYAPRSPSTPAVLIQLPSTPPAFGGRIDIELPRSADILKSAEIRITMPTWLPPEVAAINREIDKVVEIETPPGTLLPSTPYGWVNGFPNFLIQKWQLIADTLILTEGYGNYSSWEPYMVTTNNRAPILNAIAGQSSESNRNIQERATPPQLTFRVPLPGCQHDADVGLPLCALRSRQKLFLRLWLSPLQKMVESGPTPTLLDMGAGSATRYDTCPAPWGGKRIYINGSDAAGYRTLQEYEVGQPTIEAYYNVLYLDAEARAAVTAAKHEIAYKSQFTDVLTFDRNSWIVGSTIKRILNVRGYFQALFLQFAASLLIDSNKYRDCNPPIAGAWVTQMSLVVNGIERIYDWNTQQLQQVAQNIRLPRDIPDNLFLLQFGTEIDHEPAGAFFLTQTHKAELRFTIGDAALFPDEIGTYVTLYIYGQGWGILDIIDGVVTNRYPG
jgi:hypothetical protein